jgi:hypothetical protein
MFVRTLFAGWGEMDVNSHLHTWTEVQTSE